DRDRVGGAVGVGDRSTGRHPRALSGRRRPRLPGRERGGLQPACQWRAGGCQISQQVSLHRRSLGDAQYHELRALEAGRDIMRTNQMAKIVVAVAIAAATIGTGPSATAQEWTSNSVKQKMRVGLPVVAKRIDTADPAAYCNIASTPGTDFTWTDMVHSGLEFSYVWQMWAAPCPNAVAKLRGAEIFYSGRGDFV